MKKQQKGFTLIELMVVIVIIGILAAIAIPKLFGMTAKAKASEVGPASGTWSKLQQAYFMEMSAYGSWDVIAYRAPGATAAGATGTTGAFTYTGNPLSNNITQAQSVTWSAQNFAKLGDCPENQTWSAQFTSTATDAPTANLPTNTSCRGLTPNFQTLK